MNRDQAFTDLTMIFREVFDNDSIQISDQMTAKDIKQWDSLNHINLIVSAEKSSGYASRRRKSLGWRTSANLSTRSLKDLEQVSLCLNRQTFRKG